MHVLLIASKRKNLVLSIEDKTTEEGKVFQSKYSTDERFFNLINAECTDSVFDTVEPIASQLTAPKVIESATAPKDAARLNIYVENGVLKVA